MTQMPLRTHPSTLSLGPDPGGGGQAPGRPAVPALPSSGALAALVPGPPSGPVLALHCALIDTKYRFPIFRAVMV